MRPLLLLLLVACVESPTPLPDAAVLELDACVREPSGDCCSLLPDENAVRACVLAESLPDTCGVAVCWTRDCELVRVNFCNRTDAGVD